MIRNPIQSVLRRSRPELSRLDEGIAASLRQFSVAQARYSDDAPSRPTGRQRSAAAAKELLSMSGSKPRPQSGGAAAPETKPASASASASAPKVISVTTLRGGAQGRFAGFRKTTGPEGSSSSNNNNNRGSSAGNVIRGGFRPRGGFRGTGFAAQGGAGGRADGRRGRGGGAGAGRRGGRDDRPARRRRQRDDEREGDMNDTAIDKHFARDYSGAETYVKEKAEGLAAAYNPTSPKTLLEGLVGYAPVLPISGSPLAKSATTVYHARVLGSGRPYNPDDWMDPREARQRYKEGEGVFFPVPEAKAWTEKTTRMSFKAPPQETSAAVVEATLLGKYDAPKAKGLSDTVGTIKNYTSRDGTWNAAAGRTLEAKVMSLLPSAAPGGAAATKPTGKRA